MKEGYTVKREIDILIKNGQVINPEHQTITKRDIAIFKGEFVDYTPGEDVLIKDIIDADGYYISPGWIDSHCHIFKEGTEAGFDADLNLIPMGVTTAIDGGSCGVGNWPLFKRTIVDNSYVNVFYSINVSTSGQITETYPENVNPAFYNYERIKEIMDLDIDHARGIKLRYGEEVVSDNPEYILEKTVELAEMLGCSITLHVTNSPRSMDYVVSKMRAGDVLCHVYQGKQNTLLDDNGQIRKSVWEARKRGIIFDSADARINHSYRVILPAVKEGFFPDIISTDITKNGLYTNMCWGLPVVLSKWLNLNMSLENVIAACTYNPAKAHKLPWGIGTLNTGANANVTIFSVENHPFHLVNRMNEEFDGEKLIIPQVTIINGVVRFKNLYFPF